MTERPTIALLIPPASVPRMFTSEVLARLEGLGQVVRAEGTTQDVANALPELLLNADVAVTGWGTPQIPAELFGPRLKLIAHAAGSVKRHVPQEVVERGVLVSHAADVIADAVCEFTLCLILLGLRRPHEMDAAIKRRGEGHAATAASPDGHTLAGCRVGVVGAGYVGRKVARLLGGLGARVSLYDPYLTAEGAAELGGTKVEDLDALFAASQVVTLHAPVTPETERMVGAAQLACLPDGALFINVARSALVDQDALFAELQTGRIWAALDVFDAAPPPAVTPILTLPNVLATPHRAGTTQETHARQGAAIVEEIERFLGGDELRYRIPADRFALMA